jgi:hypothetical protein
LLRAHLVRMGDLRDAIQPLSIGEIADRSVTLAIQRWRTLLVLVLLEAVPIGFVRGLPGSEKFMPLWFIPDVLLVALLYAAVVFTVVAPAGAAPGKVLGAAVQRFGSSLATFLLSALWIGLWLGLTTLLAAAVTIPFVALKAPINAAAILFLAGAIAGVVLLPRPGLVAATMIPIAILEGVSPFVALTRARRRVKQAGPRRSWLLGLAIFAVTIAPSLAIGAAIDTIVKLTHLSALRAFDELFTDAVTTGFGIVLATVIALEMRARTEGTDLEAALEPSAS